MGIRNLYEISVSFFKRCIHLLKQHLKDPLYRNSLFLMANTAVTTVLGFLFWIVVARYYSEAEVGWGNAILNAIYMLALFSRLGFDIAIIRFLPKAEKPVQMINSCFVLTGIVSLVLSILFVAAVDVLSPAMGFINNNAIFALAFIVFAVLWTLSCMMDQVFIARRRADFVLYKSTLYSVLKMVLPFVLVYFFYTFGIVSSWGIAAGIGFFISLFLFLPRALRGYRVKLKVDFDIIKSMWRYSFGNYFVILLSAVPVYILPLLIVNRLGAEENAFFGMSWMIVGLLFVIPGAVAQSLFTEGSHLEEKLDENVRRSYKFIFILLIPAIALLLACGKWLLLAFGKSYYESALPLLQVLAISGIFMGINSVYYTVLQVEKRIMELAILNGVIALAVLIGSYLTISATGIIGVGYIWSLVQGVVSVYIVVRMIIPHKRRT